MITESASIWIKAAMGSLTGSLLAIAAITPDTLGGWSLVITAITGAISAIGVILIAFLNRKVKQVEKQGNSVSLELKRTNSIYARRLAVATKDKGDKIMADDAERIYEEAYKNNAKL